MLARKIALNTMISALARILATALALVTIGLATRYLSKTGWGQYSIVLTFGGIFAVLAEWGLYQLLVREISKENADQEKIVSNLFTMRLFISLFIFGLAPLASLLFPYSKETRLGILVGMAGFWLLADCQVLMGVFQKYLKMYKTALAEVIGRAAQLASIFVFIKFDWGYLWLVSSLVFGGLANFILVFWFAQRDVRVRLRFDFRFWGKSLKESFPLAVSNVLVMIYFSTDSLFLSLFRPAAEVGAYRLPYKILESLIFFPSMFVGLIMPLLSRFAGTNWPGFKRIFQRAQDVLIIFALPLVFGAIFLSPAIMNLLGGGKYPESALLLNVLIVAVSLIFLGTLFSFALIAVEKQKKLLWISLVGAVFNVSANLIFMQLFLGKASLVAALTTVLTEFLVTVLMFWTLVKSIKFTPSFRIFWKSLGAALVMSVGLFFLKEMNFILALSAGILIYFGALYLLKGLVWAEVLSLFKKDVAG